MTARNGSAEWHGDIKSGSGTVTVGNGVFESAYSYGSRFGEDEGTNPEQLSAAAQAACPTMALSNILAAAGHAPESVRTNARVQLHNANGAPMLARLDLDAEGRIRGWSPAPGGKTETGIDAFVAAVIQTHERVQRNLWRLATERIWPAASEARTDCQLIELSRLGKQR